MPAIGSSSTPTLSLQVEDLGGADHEFVRVDPPLLDELGQEAEVEQRAEVDVDAALAEGAQRRLLRADGVAEAAIELVDAVVVRLDDRARAGALPGEVAQVGSAWAGTPFSATKLIITPCAPASKPPS